MFDGLRKKLEELVADVNPFDGGRTGATVRASRVAQTPTRVASSVPAQTPRAGAMRMQQPQQSQQNRSLSVGSLSNGMQLLKVESAAPKAQVRPQWRYQQRADGGHDFYNGNNKSNIDEYTKATGSNRQQLVQKFAQGGDRMAQTSVRRQQSQDRMRQLDDNLANSKASVYNPMNIAGDIFGAAGKAGKAVVDMGTGAINDLGNRAADFGQAGAHVIREFSGENQRMADQFRKGRDDTRITTQRLQQRLRTTADPIARQRITEGIRRINAIQSNQDNAEQQLTREALEATDPRKTLVNAGVTALDLATLGKGRALMQGVKGLESNVTRESAKQLGRNAAITSAQGAGIGGVYGGLETARDANARVGDYARNIATGAVAGGALGLGAQVVLPVAGVAGRQAAKAVNQVPERVQNYGLLRPTQLSDPEIFAVSQVQRAQRGQLDPQSLTDADWALYRQAEAKVGNPGTPAAKEGLAKAVDAHRSFEVERASRQRTAQEALSKTNDAAIAANDFARRRLLPGGTLDAPLNPRKSSNLPMDRRDNLTRNHPEKGPESSPMGTGTTRARLDNTQTIGQLRLQENIAKQADDYARGQDVGVGATPRLDRQSVQRARSTASAIQDRSRNYTEKVSQGKPELRLVQGKLQLVDGAAYDNTISQARTPREAAGVDDGVTAKNLPIEQSLPRTAKSKFASETLKSSDQVSAPTKRELAKDSPEYQVETEKQRFTESAARREQMGDDAFTRNVRDKLETKSGSADSQTIADAQTAAARADANGDYLTATEIYDKISEHLTTAGQTVQAAAVLARRSPEGLRYHAQKTLKKAGVELTEERQKALTGYVDEVRKARQNLDKLQSKPDTPRNQIRNAEELLATARENVQFYVATQIPSKSADKIVNFWRSGLLTAPTTTAGAVLGNAETFFARKIWTNPASAVADWAMSTLTGKRTVSRAKAGEFLNGAIEGAKALDGQYWRTGRDKMLDGQKVGKYDQPISKINYGQGRLGRAMGGYVNGVYSLMGAVDKPFRYGAYRESLSSQARAHVDTLRLQGRDMNRQQRSELYDEFMDNPPKQAQQRATDEALYETFQNKTILGDAVGSMKQWAKREGHSKTAALMDFLMPFTGVPSSIATRVIQRTPINTVNEVVKQILAVRKGESFDQRAMAKAIGEGTAGVPIIAAGFLLANAGELTGGYPRDEKTRKEWEQTGKQPNSIRIGDRWYSLNYLQPFGTLLNVGKSMSDSNMDGDQIHETLLKGAGAGVNSVTSMSFLSGLSDAVSLATEGASESSINRWAGNTVASAVPNFIRSLARSSDELQRDTNGNNIAETIGMNVAGAIPGVRQNLPAKLDQFGGDLPAKDGFINQFINPFRPSKVVGDGDPVVREMSRLLSVDEGVKPTGARKSTFSDVELTKEEIREINAIAGPRMREEYAKVIGDERYASLSDADKAKALKSVNDAVFGAVKNVWGYEKGYVKDEAMSKLTTNQKRIIKGEDVSYINGSGSFLKDLPKNINTVAKSVLEDADTADRTDEWKKELTTNKDVKTWLQQLMPNKTELPDITNEVALKWATYKKEKEAGKIGKLEDNDRKVALLRDVFNSQLNDDERKLYQLSKARLQAAINDGLVTNENIEKALKVEKQMYDAGVINETTLAKKLGLASSKRGGGGGKRGGSRGGGSRKGSFDYKLFGFEPSGVSNSKQLYDMLAKARIKSSGSKVKKPKIK